MFKTFCSFIVYFSKRRPDWAGFILGALLTLAIPPAGFFPLLFLCFSGLLWLLQHARNGFHAALIGWAFGCGYFMISFYWLGYAFAWIYQDLWWFFPFAALVIPFYAAFYYGLMAGIVFFYRRQIVIYTLLFAAGIFWIEYLRSILGLPQNHLVASLEAVLPVMQGLSIFGTYVFTFFVILWAALPYLWGQKDKPRRLKALIVCILASLILMIAFGSYRLWQSPLVLNDNLHVQIIQPHVTVEERRDPARRDARFQRHLDLMATYPPAAGKKVLTLWSEGVYSAQKKYAQDFLPRLAEVLRPDHYAAIGVYTREKKDNKKSKLYNRLLVINPAGDILASYDKSRLVPWTEYLPFEEIMKKTPLYEDLYLFANIARGTGPTVINTEVLPAFSPAICFETAFPDLIVPDGKRPDFITSVTNDAWVKNTVGPYQAMAVPRLRALEEGLPVLHAANIGGSGVFDSYGRKVVRLEMGKIGVINTPLPRPAAPTFFSKTGNRPWVIFFLIFSFVLLVFGACKNAAYCKTGPRFLS